MLRRVVFVLALVTGARLAAQDTQRFSAGTDLVVLHVGVADRNGRHRTGLPKEAFTVLENGQRQEITFFTSEDIPATVGLLIDSSLSMWSLREAVIAASAEFAASSNPADEVFALAFNDEVIPALPPDAPFTSDPGVLRTAVSSAVTARWRTALFDAISSGLDYLSKGTHPRKVLVILSDGGDTASRTTLDEVLAKTQTSNVVVYTVALVDRSANDINPALLRRLADMTGGEALDPDVRPGVGISDRDRRQITDALRTIARDIRESYALGYVPTKSPDGTFRTVEVSVASPDRQPLVVRTRRGYVAGLTAQGSRLTP